MIPISNDFKIAMKQPVKEIQAYVGDIKSEDDLISFSINVESSLCKTAMRKLEAKYTGEHNLLGQWVHAGFGVKLPSGTFEYLDYGSFLITEITTVKDTGITTIVGYDKMVNSMKEYTKLDVEYPINLIDYTRELCEACNLELNNVVFGKNLLKFTLETQTINGLTITNNNDGSLTLNGTTSDTVSMKISPTMHGLKAGKYCFSLNDSGNITGNCTKILYAKNEGNTTTTILHYNTNDTESVIGTANEDYLYYYFWLYIPKGTVFDNYIIKPQLEMGTTYTGWQEFNDMTNWALSRELWENIDGITYRDIFVQIAQVTGTTCIIKEDKVYFKVLEETSEELTYDNMFRLSLEPKYGEINSIVLSRTPQEDNVYMRDEESIEVNGLTEFKIENNEIVDKDRDNAMTPIYKALKGTSYYPFESTTEGLGWYELGDKINITNDAGDSFDTVIFKISITIDGSVKETLKASAETKTQTQYQFATTIAKRVKNTEILVNKQDQYIQQLVEDVYEENGVINKNFTEVHQNITNIINKVQNSGGTNLIKNSVMFAYDTNKKPSDWDIINTSKNIAKIEMVQGAYGFSDGAEYWYENYIRTANKISVVAGETYTLSFKGTQPTSWDSGFIFFKDGVYHSCLAQQSLTFTVPEGANQVAYDLCGSTGIQPTDIWDIQLEKGTVATDYVPYEDGIIDINSNTEALNNGGISGHSFTLKNMKAVQKVFVSSGSTYTFSTRIKKGLDGACYVKLYNDNEEYIIEVPEGEESFYKEYELQKLIPTDNYYIIEFYGSKDSDATFTDNMLSVGEYKSQWSQANGEIMNTQVIVNKDGMLVKSSIYLGDYTIMSPLEFAGYSNIKGTITKVFSLNKDITYTKKLEAEDEIHMTPIKIVPITTGELQGWAFVPSAKEV